MQDNFTLNPELQEKFLKGIEKVSSLIALSYGPRGKNVSIESHLYPYHSVVNDAQSIIQSLYFHDPIERAALNFVKELCDKASKDSAEGRKTTILIAKEILKGGWAEKVDGDKLNEELHKLLPVVLESIDNQSQRVELNGIGLVAETSSRSKETGDWMQKIYNEIGQDGIIEVEGSGTYDTSYKVTDGVKFKAGWLSANMVYDENAVKEGRPEKETIYENPIVLVTKRKIEKDADIAPLIQKAINENKPLVIFTDDMDNNVAFRLIATHKAKVAKILIIRAPVLWKNYIFEDFAKCVGATIVEDATGINFKNLKVEHLGTCEKLICDREETILRGIADISGHKQALEQEGSNDSRLRLQWLNTKTALLRLGAGSESELSYKLLKAKDAVSACRLALMEGVVEGAGKSLIKQLVFLDTITVASSILALALQAPCKQLVDNNGGKLGNTKGVYDATLVIKNAVKNAVSLAGIVLTTGADIRLSEKSFEDKQLEILYKQKNPF